MQKCYCGSQLDFSHCCEPYILLHKKPLFPEQLMRSRYSAYVLQNANYILATTHVSERHQYSKKDIEKWAKENTWLKLEVLEAKVTTVTFKVYFLDSKGVGQVHHEQSTFKKEKGEWFYVDGTFY